MQRRKCRAHQESSRPTRGKNHQGKSLRGETHAGSVGQVLHIPSSSRQAGEGHICPILQRELLWLTILVGLDASCPKKLLHPKQTGKTGPVDSSACWHPGPEKPQCEAYHPLRRRCSSVLGGTQGTLLHSWDGDKCPSRWQKSQCL